MVSHFYHGFVRTLVLVSLIPFLKIQCVCLFYPEVRERPRERKRQMTLHPVTMSRESLNVYKIFLCIYLNVKANMSTHTRAHARTHTHTHTQTQTGRGLSCPV